MLLRHMTKHFEATDPEIAHEFLKKAEEAQARAAQVRKACAQHEELSVERVEQAVES